MEKILIIDDSPVQANFLSSILDGDYEITVSTPLRRAWRRPRLEIIPLFFWM